MSQATNWRTSSIFQQKRMPSAAPASVPTTPMLAPVIRNTRMMAPLLAPMVRRMPISRPLSFTSMMSPEMMLKAATTHDHRQDDEHHVALHLEHGEEALVALAPVGEVQRGDARLLHGGHLLGRLLRIVHQHLEHVDVSPLLK